MNTNASAPGGRACRGRCASSGSRKLSSRRDGEQGLDDAVVLAGADVGREPAQCTAERDHAHPVGIAEVRLHDGSRAADAQVESGLAERADVDRRVDHRHDVRGPLGGVLVDVQLVLLPAAGAHRPVDPADGITGYERPDARELHPGPSPSGDVAADPGQQGRGYGDVPRAPGGGKTVSSESVSSAVPT